MKRFKKIVQVIEATDFDRNMKILLSLALTVMWLVLLSVIPIVWFKMSSKVISQEFLVVVTLPIFGFLYHKLFVLIDTQPSFTNPHYSIRLETSRWNNKPQVVFGRTSYINLPMEKERLRSIKRKADQDPLARIQVVLGDRPSSLELFEEVFGHGHDPRVLIVNRLFDMRSATPELEYLYINTSTVDERDLDEIAYQVNRMNEIKLYQSSRSIKEGENAE
ncbi:hypothetical protein ABQE23_09550 [Enterococcus avium]|uniref:hypothetical protein n=1 Tax=Enterococcus avium TaxID=33945 RepID=UPI0032E48F58